MTRTGKHNGVILEHRSSSFFEHNVPRPRVGVVDGRGTGHGAPVCMPVANKKIHACGQCQVIQQHIQASVSPISSDWLCQDLYVLKSREIAMG